MWRNHNFLLLWTGQSLSRIGTQITQLALPLTAAILLHGSPLQVSAMTAIEFLPAMLFGPIAGVWVDRLDRRQILIWTDIGRFVSLGSIPACYLLGILNFPILYTATFFTGLLSIIYDSAYQVLLPDLVDGRQLLDANSKLQMSQSIARGSGPAMGGTMVQWLSAPVAVAVDAVSYLVSAVCAVLIKVPRKRPEPVRRAFLGEIVEGVRAIVKHPVRWRLSAAEATDNFFGSGVIALYAVYATQDLGLSAFLTGLVFAVGPLGAIAASMVLGRVGGQDRPKETVIIGVLIRAVGFVLAPIATGSTALVVTLLCVGQILAQAGLTTLAPASVTWRQVITPNHLLGRVLASGMTIQYGTIPVGALFAGWLGEVFGIRTALAVSALGVFCTLLWLVGTHNPAPETDPDTGTTSGTPATPTTTTDEHRMP
ncbi:MFS transporter [Streptomyces piniterrae]|uniref:MFS transporter n=1 Tax=Streptomyces piniterrae TaxID=2571125 RepID=UPI00145F393A|nr:MFS transporter [Streptomyces piniterrae]